MVLFQALGPDHLRYQQNLVEQGQIWRYLSAHWVHVGWMHLLLNVTGLVICVGLTHPGWSPARWLLYSGVIGIGISLLLVLCNPEVGDYAGLSGVLFGLYLLGAFSLYARDRLIALLIIAALVIKVALEQAGFDNLNSGELIGARVIVDAHLYGLLVAIAIAIALGWARYTMNNRPETQSN
jgi:rhomboid family GlyGly-CTERM serine protease